MGFPTTQGLVKQTHFILFMSGISFIHGRTIHKVHVLILKYLVTASKISIFLIFWRQMVLYSGIIKLELAVSLAFIGFNSFISYM